MCGRFGFIPRTYFPKRFGIQEKLPEIKPHFNITPGMQMPIIIKNSPNSVVMMRWGFIPFWAKDPKIGYKMINARVETLAEKPSFRKSLSSKRCLVPASLFYEWDHVGKIKIPYCIELKDLEMFAFAGLYDEWKDAEGYLLKTFTIITTNANSLITKIHSRMPVILNEKDENIWLDKNISDIPKLLSLLQPYDSSEMKMFPISKDVNNPDNDNENIIKPLPI